MAAHRGWHSRGYLPHLDQPGLIQGITFRLHDSLPANVIEELAAQPRSSERRSAREAHLNAGYGACYLRDARIGRLVEQALHHFDGDRYRLLAWVIMPNHVHVLIETLEGYLLEGIVHSWKSYTASKANEIVGRSGPFWFKDYFDRYIRDEVHFANTVRYIHNNPVAAGLVARPEDWPFSSARLWPD